MCTARRGFLKSTPVHLLIILAFSARLSGAALPPGYEDELYCPPGYCRRAKALLTLAPALGSDANADLPDFGGGFVGSLASQNECYSPVEQDTKAIEPWGPKCEDCKQRANMLETCFHEVALVLCEGEGCTPTCASDANAACDYVADIDAVEGGKSVGSSVVVRVNRLAWVAALFCGVQILLGL